MIRKIDSNKFSLTILKVTTFSRIRQTLFCASIVLCFGFCGCSNDDDENSTSKEKKLVKITQTTNKSRNETTSFDYDEQGYLLTIIGEYTYNSYHGSYKYSYKWSDNYTSVKEYSKGKACYEYSFVDGLARSGNWLDQYEIIAMGFIYDNKSRLSSYDCGYDYSADISWENNCISEVTSFGKIVYSGNTCKGYNPYIVYNASSTPFYELAIAQPRLFGLHTNQLPKEIKGQAANGGDHNIDISYELDKDGYLIKLTATHHSSDFWDDGKIETYEYTWQ